MKKFVIGIILLIALAGLYIGYIMHQANSVTPGSPIDKYTNPHKALIIIDLQRDLTEANGKLTLNTRVTDSVIENVNRILDKNKDLVVIYIRQESDNILAMLATGGAMQHGEPGSDFDQRLKIKSNNIFIKHVSDSFSNPALDKFLVNNSVDHIYVTGVDARYCVDKTIKAALNRKYKVTVVNDSIGSASTEIVNNKILDFTGLGADTISTDQLLNILR